MVWLEGAGVLAEAHLPFYGMHDALCSGVVSRPHLLGEKQKQSLLLLEQLKHPERGLRILSSISFLHGSH